MNVARATSFGAWADEYDRWRPSYPDAAVDWLVPAGAIRLAEVGAGTGKLTDRLVERGLDDASVDAVLVADAWHWFPQEDAAREASRVLRPGEWLGCVWNVPAPRHDWEWQALRLDPLLSPPSDQDPLDRLGLSTGRAETQAFRWTWTLTPQQWRGFVSTTSHVALLPDDERTATLNEVEQAVAQACTAAGASGVPLVHDAVCVRWYPEP